MKYYSDETNKICKETKTMLDKHNIRYEHVDVTDNPSFLGGEPVLELDDGTVLEGKEEILKWLGYSEG